MAAYERHPRGKKLVFEERSCPPVKVSKLREICTENILKMVLLHVTLEKYLPDKVGINFRIDQDFLLRLVKIIEPEKFSKLTDATFKIR